MTALGTLAFVIVSVYIAGALAAWLARWILGRILLRQPRRPVKPPFPRRGPRRHPRSRVRGENARKAWYQHQVDCGHCLAWVYGQASDTIPCPVGQSLLHRMREGTPR